MITALFSHLAFLAVSATAGLGGPSSPALSAMLGSIGSAATAFLADISTAVPPPSLGAWLQNLLYVFGVAFFLLGGIEKIKGLFGRTPPIGHEIEKLRGEMKTMEKDVCAEIAAVDRRRSAGVAGAHSKIDAQDTGVQTELRLMNARISETEGTLKALDERTKGTLHTVDSISGKVDTLLGRGRRP
jgi:hypothetical protein